MTQRSRTERFLHNVIWSWLGVVLNAFIGLVLSPVIIRRLGPDSFGVWSLVLALVEYYWLVDFGFRNATVKYTAHYMALDQPAVTNRVLNTSLMYSCMAGALMLAVTLVGAPLFATRFASDAPAFANLFRIVGITWSFGLVFNVFNAGLEGLQRYDLTSRIWLASTVVRAVGMVAVLMAGYGLEQLALVLLASQTVFYVLSFYVLRRTLPSFTLGWQYGDRALFSELFAFAKNSFLVSMATRVLAQGAPLMIGWMLPVRYVGYYTMPQKTLEYAADGVSRLGMVAGVNAAAMAAKGEWDGLARLGIGANRYCVSLYLLLTAFLLVYGAPVLTVWINADFAEHSAHLLPVLLVGITALNSQFSSACILMNMGRQEPYARALVVEAVLLVGALWWVIPRYGLAGVAATVSLLMLLHRGLYVAWLTSKELQIGLSRFFGEIYLRPVAIALLTYAVYRTLHATYLPGRNKWELLAAGLLGAIPHLALFYALILSPEHRQQLRRLLPV